jgi:hypothetical protein
MLHCGHFTPWETGSNYAMCRRLFGLENWFGHTGDYFVVVIVITIMTKIVTAIQTTLF